MKTIQEIYESILAESKISNKTIEQSGLEYVKESLSIEITGRKISKDKITLSERFIAIIYDEKTKTIVASDRSGTIWPTYTRITLKNVTEKNKEKSYEKIFNTLKKYYSEKHDINVRDVKIEHEIDPEFIYDGGWYNIYHKESK